ncbi:MAG: hypothetical protein OHK93_006911 [Ramalina farinacea]|uniref:Uncharacterized protein n=1 Tax=Ramalina farinacea TaxID=258253 RepID=A0AA43QJF7_9LECA|nr:hypothetical protein [Ramalina farinacea]
MDTDSSEGTFKPGFDYELVISTALYWSMIELALALIAACLPTMSYFFRRASPAVTTRSNKGPPFSQLKENSTQDSVTDRAAPLNGRLKLGQVETYAMNDITWKRSQGRAERSNGIWIDSTITQQRDIV